MSKLTIIAHIMAKTDAVEVIKSELQKLIDPTRAETGCVQYDLHHDNENPNHFMFFESWESRDLWEQHMNSQHLAEFKKAVDGAVEELTIYEMTQIG